MTVKAVISLATGSLAVLLLGLAGTAALAQAGHEVVNCFDAALGTVQKTLAGDCSGEVITDDEAAAVRQERRDYIQKILSKAPHPDVRGKQLASLGSGFFVAGDGSVVTSHHVVADCAAVSITPTFGEMKLATKVVSQADIDLALLRTDIAAPGIANLITGDGPAVLGSAFVIGYPNQGLVTIEPVLTPVEVLGRERDTPRGPVIVLRGDIRRGNSGGPLLDSGGNVVGVVFAKVDSVNVYQATGQAVREIGLASPGEVLQAFLKDQGIDYQTAQGGFPQPEDRILEEARPFLAQIGCWR
jgi:hypothetical protein